MKTALRHITIDYSRYGRAETITVRLFPEEREGLHVGQHFVVDADDVPSREAVVSLVHSDGRQVELTFVPV